MKRRPPNKDKNQQGRQFEEQVHLTIGTRTSFQHEFFHLDPFGTVDGRISAPVDIMVALSQVVAPLGFLPSIWIHWIIVATPLWMPSRRFFSLHKTGGCWGINRFQDWPYYVEAQFASDWRGWMLLNVADLDSEIFGLRRLPIDLMSLSRPLQIYGKSLSIDENLKTQILRRHLETVVLERIPEVLMTKMVTEVQGHR